MEVLPKATWFIIFWDIVIVMYFTLWYPLGVALVASRTYIIRSYNPSLSTFRVFGKVQKEMSQMSFDVDPACS